MLRVAYVMGPDRTGMSAAKACEPCEGSGYSWRSFLILGLMLAGMVLLGVVSICVGKNRTSNSNTKS